MTADNEEFQTRLAFYEREISELRETLDTHQRQILALEQRCDLLVQRMAQLLDDLPGSEPGDERPPHY